MDYIVDTLTKTPSQALVKSASSFGEEAAKIIGGYMDEGIRNVSEDISSSIRDGTKDVAATVKEVLLLFVEKFKETGVEGFTEWGICIERAFVHLGQKTETGVGNAGNRVADSIERIGEKAVHRMEETVCEATRQITKDIRNVGMRQIEHMRKVFGREISMVSIGFLLACFALLLISITYAVSSGIVGYLLRECNIISVALAVLNGYIAYSITMHTTTASVSGNTSSTAPDTACSSPSPHLATVEEQGCTSNVNAQNSNILVIAIGAIGFLIGSITKEVFGFGWFSAILTTLVMSLVTILAFKAFQIHALARLFRFWKLFQEFLEWKTRQELQELEELRLPIPYLQRSSEPHDLRVPTVDLVSEMSMSTLSVDSANSVDDCTQQQQTPVPPTPVGEEKKEVATNM